MRMIDYARASLHREKSVGEQHEEMDMLAEEESWDVVARLTDNRKSASRYAMKLPPEYVRAMEMLRNGEADGICFWDMDRLMRQPKELEKLIDMCDPRMGGRENILIRSYSEDVPFNLTTADGRHHARGIVAAAARESDKTSQRVKRDRRRRRAKLLPPPGPAFGWLDAKTTNPKQEPVVKDIIMRFLAGERPSPIARRLNEAGVPRFKSAQPWDHESVRSILSTPRNYGLVATEPERLPPYQTHTRNPAAPAKVVRGAFEGIVAPELYAQVVSALSERADRRAHPKRAGLLAGLVFCARCGMPMQRNTAGLGRKVLSCRNDAKGRCGAGPIDYLLIEEEITKATWLYVDNLSLAEIVDPSPNTEPITARLAEIAEERARITEDRRTKALDYEGWREMSGQLATEEAALQASLIAKAKVTVLKPYAGRPGVLRAAWETLEVDVRRQVIADALNLGHVRLVVTPKFYDRQPNVRIDRTDREWARAELARLVPEEVAEEDVAA